MSDVELLHRPREHGDCDRSDDKAQRQSCKTPHQRSALQLRRRSIIFQHSHSADLFAAKQCAPADSSGMMAPFDTLM
ncbi:MULTISPECIES: hypothetical protein [unclassified Bradyrhizobium]|uniref:hypothetical protein n=1 Tax=unclassified Bradyrhizobium TaxID=2631580 RepID=UPI0024E12D3A|nr:MULTISPECIES: hypothetical protein [unclassified Bradyrhizobium]